INKLWDMMRTAVTAAYLDADKRNDQDGICLRDYAENTSWSDNMAALLGRESANERRHRSNRPSVQGFSVDTAAKLILMTNMAEQATRNVMPNASAFLVLRQTAVEAEVLGFLARTFLSDKWRVAVKSFDYAKLMQA